MFRSNELWKFRRVEVYSWRYSWLEWSSGPGVSWPAIGCDPGLEIANVNHFESLRARMSNEFSARTYNARLCKRSNELCVKLDARIDQAIVRCWRFMVSQKFRFEPIRGKPLINLVACDFETRGKSDIRVESCQRFVSQ